MATIDTPQVLRVLGEAAQFTRRMGFEAEAKALEEFSARFEHEKPTLKILRGPVQDAKDNASRRIREGVLYDEHRCVRTDKTSEYAEFNRIWKSFGDLIYPQKFVPAKMKGLVPGKDRTTSVLGDVKEARKIAAQALDITKRFSEAVINDDTEAAYALCANEFRSRISVKQFASNLEKWDRQYSGKPIKYVPESITWIYADESSRQENNKEGDWPKETPKPNKRAMVGGWWTARKTTQREFGRSVFFWVTEETSGYRIAKFEQYHQ